MKNDSLVKLLKEVKDSYSSFVFAIATYSEIYRITAKMEDYLKTIPILQRMMCQII